MKKMKLKRLLFAVILGFSLLSFGTLSQAAESIHDHGEGTVHNHENELQSGDVQPMYVPCPVTGGMHTMNHSNTETSNGGNTGVAHYHGIHYCQPYIEITNKLFSCTKCGFSEWRRSTATIHPGQ